MLTRLPVVILSLLILSGASLATWDHAAGRGLIPFWINTPTHYTMIVFINGSEYDSDTVHLRFCDTEGSFCSDTTGDLYSIRQNEMLMFSTRANPPSLFTCRHIPVTAPHGYAMFGAVEGGFIHAFAFIVNDVTGQLATIPIYAQDKGF
ncbi:MAG: hypothetical protein JW759_00055 [Candidatus Coatesbacteria bacterium]|nr:hypothetical protein [Candidatus Coatesbacteria bacterium]